MKPTAPRWAHARRNNPSSSPRNRSTRGQSMIEALLIMPVLMVLVLNAINFGYFFLVALNLTEAPRAGAAYSILGFASNAAESLPSPGPPTNNSSVSYLTYRDLTGAINSPTSASIQV